MATTTSERWHYNGDVNLEHGGAFIDLSDWQYGYASAVRVSDLDGGCGFTGAVLIEHVVICGLDDAKRIRQAVESCGGASSYLAWGPRRDGETPADRKRHLRHAIADALMSYGYSDPDDNYGYGPPQSETLQLEPDGPMVFDGWKASKRLKGTTLEAYVRSVHLRD
jgi:hypothetical protein